MYCQLPRLYSEMLRIASISQYNFIRNRRGDSVQFNEILLELMQQCGYTNYKLAQMMDISQSTVAYWVEGKGLPQRSKRKQLAGIFGVSVDELMGKTKKPAAENGSGGDIVGAEDEVVAKKERIIRMLDNVDPSDYDRAIAILELLQPRQDSQAGSHLKDG